VNRLWRPDRERREGESLLHYLWTAKDADLIRWEHRRTVGFAIMTFGVLNVASAATYFLRT
jgi:hypothetical protein